MQIRFFAPIEFKLTNKIYCCCFFMPELCLPVKQWWRNNMWTNWHYLFLHALWIKHRYTYRWINDDLQLWWHEANTRTGCIKRRKQKSKLFNYNENVEHTENRKQRQINICINNNNFGKMFSRPLLLNNMHTASAYAHAFHHK